MKEWYDGREGEISVSEFSVGVVNRFVGVHRGYQLGCHEAQGKLNNLEEKWKEF